MNPMLYMQWMNPAAYAAPSMGTTAGTTNFLYWFNPNAWMPALTPGAAPQPPKGQAGKK